MSGDQAPDKEAVHIAVVADIEHNMVRIVFRQPIQYMALTSKDAMNFAKTIVLATCQVQVAEELTKEDNEPPPSVRQN